MCGKLAGYKENWGASCVVTETSQMTTKEVESAKVTSRSNASPALVAASWEGSGKPLGISTR